MYSPTIYSVYLFWRIKGKIPNISEPRGMDEKLMWLKLHKNGSSPLISQCSDKYAVREYVEKCGYREILNELYGVWDSVDQIRWSELPNSFVLKCNHGCGYNIICPDKKKLCIEETEKQLNEWMHEDYWLKYGEVQYRSIQHKIICEKMLGDGVHMPYDYKIYCFNGKPKYIMVCEGREKGKPKFFFMDKNWNFCRMTQDGINAPDGFTIQRPEHLEKMIEIAERLSNPFIFVRVDLYSICGKIVFSELTFTPAACLDVNRLPEVDRLFGQMIDLKAQEMIM